MQLNFVEILAILPQNSKVMKNTGVSYFINKMIKYSIFLIEKMVIKIKIFMLNVV